MMKFVLVILIVFVLLWLLRGRRRPDRPHPGTARTPEGSRPVVACAQCGLHLPRDEALPGRGGVFCGEAHRAEYERRHPVA